MKRVFCFFVLAVLVAACSFEKKAPENTPLEPKAIRKFVNYEISSFTEMMGPCKSDSAQRQCLIFQVEFPVITGLVPQSVAEKLNYHIEKDILSSSFISNKPGSFKELKEELNADYTSMISDFPDYNNAWVFEVNSDILYQDSLFISVATTVYSYTGGAHPNSGQVYRSYDLRTGDPITLDQLLVENYEAKLYPAAEIEFRMTREIPPEMSLQEGGFWFDEGQFSLNENFAIINKSLVFYFNPYEIAPYSVGPTELELKLTDFVDLIADGSVIDGYKN
ncbi:DUF3298 and DUF4163 domain-containing protein [Roseivirga thermotolerans]|uniref:DUF3298 and DUF4163 domain-containing protein n=1 Tax=Roseivirga thermotolerans TaxID=1758176 RepID=UPI00273FD5C7|nr:DUF3298 and DUF4163 domain-containing protein [Roseivirga thermotolerans]